MDFKSLDEVFQKRLFRIPDYQRGYAWRSDADKEVVAFWNDLINLPEGKSHFTGSLTLQEMTDMDILGTDAWVTLLGFKPWYVVDGQQRLTTITILIQCIYEFLNKIPQDTPFLFKTVGEYCTHIQNTFICQYNSKDDRRTYLLGYSKNQASNNFLQREVFNDSYATVSEESYYTLNIKNAKEFFCNNLQLYEKSSNNLNEIEKIYRKLTQQLKFQLIEVKQGDDFNIFVAFETINNRGRQLSNLEKLKNRLIYLTTLYDSPDDYIRKKINTAWAEIYRQLGRNYRKSSTGKVAILDDDDFLKTHWILYYQYSRKTGNDYINYLLNGKFTVQNVLKNLAKTETTQEVVQDEDDEYVADPIEQEIGVAPKESSLTLNEISHYVKDLKNTAEMWYYTWFPQDAKNKLGYEEIRWMERINRLGIAYFRPLITALFFERLVPKEKGNNISEEDSIKMLKEIERFIFIEFRLQTTRSNYGSSEFNIAALDLHRGKKNVDEILKMLAQRINHSFEIDETTNQMYFKTRNMQVMVDKLFEQKDDERTGFYRWSAIHYFLFEYNAELSKNYHGQGKIEWDSFKQSEKDKISIEHIFPHKAEGYWAEKFGEIPQDEWPIYQGSLGNLLLLSQKINAKLQNDDFKTKVEGRNSDNEDELRIGYKNGSVSELKISENSDWTPEKIEERGLDMLKFMESRWNFKFKSKEDKLALILPLKS